MTSMIASCLGVVPGPQDRLLKVRCMGHGGVDNGSRWLTIAVVIRHVLPGVTFRLAFDHFDGAGYVIVATADAALRLYGRLYTDETDPNPLHTQSVQFTLITHCTLYGREEEDRVHNQRIIRRVI